MRWTLFILFCLLGAPAHAVAIPGVTTGTSTSQQAAPEPSPEQKKAAYAALADVLENEASRNELIAQLREASTTPTEPAPALAPPAAKRYWRTSPPLPVSTAMLSLPVSPSFIATSPMRRTNRLTRKPSPTR